jgi:hypothetical protein
MIAQIQFSSERLSIRYAVMSTISKTHSLHKVVLELELHEALRLVVWTLQMMARIRKTERVQSYSKHLSEHKWMINKTFLQ